VLMEKKKESSRSGMEIMNLLQVVFFMTSKLVGYTALLTGFCVMIGLLKFSRKRDGNVEHGLEKRMTMNTTK
jgi:hypothetical protein